MYLSSGESSASFVGVVTWKDRPKPGVSETASGLCHEGNVEQVFSLAGWLLDPQCRSRLLGDAGVYHEKTYAPSMKAIKDKYYELFRGDIEQAAGSSSDAADPSTPK